MSFRSVDPTTMRARSPPSYHDDVTKRPPPSPSNKAPPQRKLDVRSRSLLDEPSPKATPAIPSPGVVADPPADNSTKVIIDSEMLRQLQELDDDDTHEFSRDLVHGYFKQAESTFLEMDAAFAARDLEQLSHHGHFLKGSSATLGIIQVQGICEKIQHLGQRTDPDKKAEIKEAKLSPEEALAKIKPLLVRVKVECADAKKWLMNYYDTPEAGSFKV